MLTDVRDSGGENPVSITINNGLVHVLNSGETNDSLFDSTGNVIANCTTGVLSSVTGFRLDAAGRLQPIEGSNRQLIGQKKSGCAQVSFDPSGQVLVATERKSRKTYSAAFRARVALATLPEDKTLADFAKQYEVSACSGWSSRGAPVSGIIAAPGQGLKARQRHAACGRLAATYFKEEYPMADDRNNSSATLWDLIEDIRFAMFTTRDAQGGLQSRPMTTQNSREDGDDALWFFASRSGEPVADLLRDSHVNVAYADTADDAYVTVSGTASLVEDMARKRKLWSKFAQAWFPGGPEDPDLALIRVQITQAEYWNVEESKATQLFKMARAVVTGKPPVDLAVHGTVRAA